MRTKPVTRHVGRLLLAILLLTGAGLSGRLAPLSARAEATASPVPSQNEARTLEAMLERLPNRPLGLGGAMVTYADVASQTAALGVEAPGTDSDDEGVQRWIAAVMPLTLPQATGQHWAQPEWREAFGFDLFQVEQAVEYGAPPLGLTLLRGTFDPVELRAAWVRGGYQPVDLGAGDAYAVREDFEIVFSDPGSRMALGYLNVVAISEDGTLIFGSSRDGVRSALAAAD